MLRSWSLAFLFLLSGCEWFTRSGPPAQQQFERAEIYAEHHEKGSYRCTKCGTPLFSSDDKLGLHWRWPVFSKAAEGVLTPAPAALTTEDVGKLYCARCRLHVGHRCREGELLAEANPADPICALSSSLRFAPIP